MHGMQVSHVCDQYELGSRWMDAADEGAASVVEGVVVLGCDAVATVRMTSVWMMSRLLRTADGFCLLYLYWRCAGCTCSSR
jgi:hypothetical protein